VYNPANQSESELIENFVVRQKNFERIFRDIKDSNLDEISQNFLIIAQRGMGKTTLLLRLEYEIKNTPSLSHLISIRFAEEQYNIFSLCNLWENVADILEEYSEFSGIVKELDTAVENGTDNCFEIIKKALNVNKKKVVLLIDNFGDILNKFSDLESKELRDILHFNELQIIAASSRVLETTYKYDKPFFEYFKMIHLEGLKEDETYTLLNRLSNFYKDEKAKNILQTQKSRIEIIRRLTGGVPRTMILLFEIFMDESADIFEDLEHILDRVTPLYKHRMDDLSPKLQAIMHDMALAWDGITVDELERKIRLDKDKIIDNLSILEKNDLIISTVLENGIVLYQLRERFFNIWYLMRYGRTKKKEHVLWLIKFLQVWCTQNELTQRAYSHIKMVKDGTLNVAGAYYMAEALSDIVDDENLQYQLLYETKQYLEKNDSDIAKKLIFEERELSNEKRTSIFKDLKKNIHLIKYIFNINYILGFFFYRIKNNEKAIKYFEKSIKYSPNNLLSSNYLGNVYKTKKEYDKALEYYQKAIDVDSKYVYAYSNIGNVYKTKKEYDKALEYYQKAIDVDSKYVHAYNNIGIVYETKKEYDKALEYYQKAIDVDSKYVYAYSNIGDVYETKKEYDKALEYYQKAIDVDSKYVHAYNNIGNVYKTKKEYDKALEYYQKAIDVDSKYVHAYNNIGDLHYDEKEYDKALEYYQKTIDIDPNKAIGYGALGIIYAKKNEYKKALMYGEKAVGLDSKMNSILPLIYFLTNTNKQKSVQLIDEALEVEKNKLNLLIKAAIQAWDKKYKSSITYFKDYLFFEGEEDLNNETIEYLLFLISQKQYQLVYELFDDKKYNLKIQFKPVYYALMYYMQDEYPIEYKRMGEEIKKTVEELLEQIKMLEEKYKE